MYPLSDDPDKRAIRRRGYMAAVTCMDDAIGELLGLLDKYGLAERTIVVFFSDNGGGGGAANAPLRGGKSRMFEGGIRVPCIVSWPGRIPQGAVRSRMAASIDWMPTIAEYCGVELPPRKIDGKSIVSVIESDDAPSPHEVFHWEISKHWAVRQGD